MTLCETTLSAYASGNLSSYAIGSSAAMNEELGFSTVAGAFGIFTYAAGFAVAPLLLAPFSEEFGRTPMCIGSGIIFTLFSIAVALAQNLETISVCRFIVGCAGYTGSTMVGGTLADIWKTYELMERTSALQAAVQTTTAAEAAADKQSSAERGQTPTPILPLQICFRSGIRVTTT